MAPHKPVVGILGGGQLARLLLEHSANDRNAAVKILDADNAPATQVIPQSAHVSGSFAKPDAIRKLAEVSDVLTVEIEHVDTQALEQIEKSGAARVEPHWQTIRTIQSKLYQKEHLNIHAIPVARFEEVQGNTEQELQRIGTALGYPFMLKSQTQAYDGRGNAPVKDQHHIRRALDALKERPLYAEAWSDFRLELAVMVVKTHDGKTLSFTVTETVHEDSICKLTYTPARNVSEAIQIRAREIASKAVATFPGPGIFGVEMFLEKGTDAILINEIAPRPHNSGHYTIEGCEINQFEALMRVLLHESIPEAALLVTQPTIMLNILGGAEPDSHLEVAELALSTDPRLKVHLYGKAEARPGRKMGHITVKTPTMAEAERIIQPMIDRVDQIRARRLGISPPPARALNHALSPLVAVVMGSDSDLKVLQPGLDLLATQSIPFTTRITSAHRTPDHMAQYAKNAASNGIKVIIAAAGGAAHLPGMVAAYTSLPVIGIPVKPSIGDGMDSLLSIVSMPRGVPVATVAINNSVNAALLAMRILGAFNEEIRNKVTKYAQNSEEEVLRKDEKLLDIGHASYLEQQKSGR